MLLSRLAIRYARAMYPDPVFSAEPELYPRPAQRLHPQSALLEDRTALRKCGSHHLGQWHRGSCHACVRTRRARHLLAGRVRRHVGRLQELVGDVFQKLGVFGSSNTPMQVRLSLAGLTLKHYPAAKRHLTGRGVKPEEVEPMPAC